MDLGSRGLADLGNLYKEICEAKNIRGNDSEEQKKRLEKKRGMKLDDHPQFKKDKVEEVYKGKHGQSDKEYADSRSQGGKMVSGDSKMSGAEYTHGRRVKAANPGMQPDVGGKTKPKSQGKMDKGTKADLMYRKANLKKEEKDPFGRPGGKHGGVPKKGGGYDKAYQANMKKVKELEQKEEVQQVDEADSLAAMQARREKRLAAQRKREGTTASGRDFGRDDSLSADQQKKRREAEFKAGIETKKEELEASGLFTAEEIDAILEADVQFEGMHRDAKTGEVVDKAEIGKTYYPNMPKKKTSVALRKEKESQKK